MVDIVRELRQNAVLWIAVTSWFVAQMIKFITEAMRDKRFSMYTLILSTGGMPSSHSSFATAAMVGIGFKDGFNTSAFAVSIVITLVIIVDAAGVRRAAGEQAAVINMLIENLNNPNISMDQKLKELLGHTPIEVGAGVILGVIMGVIGSRVCGFV
ncbi:MAG: divergent PAP2 family protein [Clostridiales bacterium]|nr:divergent PAP2 family protein [Clostridiales bacterium]